MKHAGKNVIKDPFKSAVTELSTSWHHDLEVMSSNSPPVGQIHHLPAPVGHYPSHANDAHCCFHNKSE